MKEIEKKYNHISVEKNKYKKWLDLKIFKADVESKKQAYSIVIPPPNVTGKLHLGHAWDGSIQDLLIRFYKLNNFETLWIPGMDHAGIATQVKVEQRLKEQNISRHDLGRKKFVDKVWEWKDEYATSIRSQWEKLGLSLDYSKEKFTYSPEMNKIVNHVFVKMYEQGLIYKGKRIINWDPTLNTALSNIEVIYKEKKGFMYYFKYYFEDKKNYLLVATTRPETMFGDVCLVVNPNDNRYKKYIGKKVFNPANNNLIPIIADEYVEIEFGTGVMKCTPAHDPNDFEIGLKYNLEQLICMNSDGTMNELSNELKGLDRFVAREELIKKCIDQKTFERKEEIIHQVGYSERSNVIVEPYLSDQWFVKMDSISKEVIDFQNKKEAINFFPNRFNKTLEQWMENSYDWTISRQLWWGHQIPAWYNKKDNSIYVNEVPPKDIENWVQDEDVLDTWFSSALWPFATMEWDPQKNITEQNNLFKKFFPTSTLVTGYDIIFFWVARMIFQSLNFTKQKPFNNVLIHGLIRDEEGRKMSKSLANGIDPIEVIEEYGADALRFFLLTNSTPGQDLKFSKSKLESSWNFINKIWNASRFVLMNRKENFIIDKNILENIKKDNSQYNEINKWILEKLYSTKREVKELIEKFEFAISGKLIYDFVWNSYCNWYIELTKVNLNSENSNCVNITMQTLIYVLKEILIMLHPFIPFVTEEIYSQLNLHETILLESWIETSLSFKKEIELIDPMIKIVEAIREFRSNQNLVNKVKLNFYLKEDKKSVHNSIINNIDSLNDYLEKLCNSNIELHKNNLKDTTSISILDFFIEIKNDDFINKDEMIKELNEKLILLENEINRSEKMLSNENFTSKAKPEKLKDEKEKYAEYKKQYNVIKEKLNNL